MSTEQLNGYRTGAESLVVKLAAAAAILLAACNSSRGFPPVEPAPTENPGPEVVLYLVGDAGLATPDAPVIRQLRADVRKHSGSAEVVVAFLGDNIYENGLHPRGHPKHEEDVSYLEAQIGVVRGTEARGIFVPGNHDWGYSGERGLQQIQRQGDYMAQAANDSTHVALVPPAGCPGPVAAEVGETALLIMLETDLWLRDQPPLPQCGHRSTDESLDALEDILRRNAEGEGRQVVVLAHHPLESFGPHGGYYTLNDKLFPATNLWEPLYIPIPFVYPFIRNTGISRQDLMHGRNQRMREAFAEVFRAFPESPLAYAAGHEHVLQVFDGAEFGVGYILVSGAGSKLSPAGQGDAYFSVGAQQGEYGYMRLEIFADGGVLLTVITDGTASCAGAKPCPGEATVRYWGWLEYGSLPSASAPAPPR